MLWELGWYREYLTSSLFGDGVFFSVKEENNS